MNYSKLENETEESYIKRICARKFVDGLSWEAVADILNDELGHSYSESHYRKKYGNVKAIKSSRKSRDRYDVMDKVKIQDERSQAMAALRRMSREETLLEIAKEVADKLATSKPFITIPPHEIKNTSKKAILQLSDWHYGIEIKNTWNKYDESIAISRLGKLCENVSEVLRKENIDELYITNLGDLISGRIHETIRIQNRIDVVTQALEVSEIVAEILDSFSKNHKVYYISCSDNHSRLEPKKELSLELESFTRVIDYILKIRMKGNPNVEILESPFGSDIAQFTVFNYTIGAVHGHKDSPKSIVQNISLVTRKSYDMILSAHLHHFNCDELNNTLVVSNGSLMGVDDYADTLRLTNRPSQNLIIVSEDNVAESIRRIFVD